MKTSRDWRLVIIGTGIFLIAVLVARAVWSDADRMLEKAEAEYRSCLTSAAQAFDPVRETSQCEREWQEAQDAYWVP